MARSLRYNLAVVLTIIFTFGCTAVSAWGFTYENPAEAAFSQTRFELVLPYVSFRGHNNLFTVNHLELDLSESSVKEDLLARLDGKDFNADFATEFGTGLTIGRFSLQYRPFVFGSARLNYGLPKIIIMGTEGAMGEHNLAGSELNVLAGNSFDFTYGHPFTLSRNSQLGVGVTLRYIQGFSMGKAKITKGTVAFYEDDWKETEMDVEYHYLYTDQLQNLEANSPSELFQALFQKPSGTGFLVDLGVAYDYDRLHAGLALKNIGVIKWRNLREGSHRVQKKNIDDDFFDDFFDDFDDFDDDPEFFEEEKNEVRLANYSLSLPLVLQLQGSYRLPLNFYWHLGMEKGFSDGWGISSKPCFQTGLEWRPRHLLRLAGNLSYQDGTLGYDGLVELRLFFFWLNLHLGWVGEGEGAYVGAMTALHF